GALFIGAFAVWPLRHLFISGPSMGNKLRSAVKGVEGCVPRTTITGAWDAPFYDSFQESFFATSFHPYFLGGSWFVGCQGREAAKRTLDIPRTRITLTHGGKARFSPYHHADLPETLLLSATACVSSVVSCNRFEALGHRLVRPRVSPPSIRWLGCSSPILHAHCAR